MSNNIKSQIERDLRTHRQTLLKLLAEMEKSAWEKIVYTEEASWTIHDIIRHLVDAEKGMTRLMEVIREGGAGAPEGFDLGRWNRRAVTKMGALSPEQLLQTMTENRERLDKFIASLNEEDWDKKGRHGSGRIMRIQDICHLIADHEHRHTLDIQKAVGH